jgi:hypothetical protein
MTTLPLAERPPVGTRTEEEPPTEPGWLSEVRLRATRRVLWLRHLWSSHHYENEHLLAISHSEVDRALAPPEDLLEAEAEFQRLDPSAAMITAKLGDVSCGPADARLDHVVSTFGLSRTERSLLVLALAAAADPRLARVFGYLQDDTGPADPTRQLALALFGPGDATPPEAAADDALLRWRLAEPVDDLPPCSPSTPWRVDPALLRPLAAHEAAADWADGTTGRVVVPPSAPVLRPSALEEIVAFLQPLAAAAASGAGDPRRSSAAPVSSADARSRLEVELIGAEGSGRRTLAAQAAARLGWSLVAVDASPLASRDDWRAAATRETRRALLEGSLLAWVGADVLSTEQWRELPTAVATFAVVEEPMSSNAAGRAVRRAIRCGPITRPERVALWSSWSSLPVPESVAEWPLRPGEVRTATQAAPAGDEQVGAVCRRMLLAGTPELLSLLPLPYRWEDLVLPEATLGHLRELEAHARHRGQVLDDWGFARLVPFGRGTTVLFSGPSGTGKTMAAQVLARSLGLDLYRVDFAAVVSKYIGETEKHLKRVFEACERAPVLLLFDEADALFGKRTQVSDAHDRYANIEIDYLLQRMEQFDGTAVLATNRKGDLDNAFVRRLRFMVDFAPPGVGERERLWRLALEGACDHRGAALVEDLDWPGLARDLDLTGAGIKSAALAAAFLARSEGVGIGERHVRAAARRELEKQGVVVRPGQRGHT